MLTFLFKYPPRVFQRGDLVLAPVVPALLVALVAFGALALVTAMYSQVRAVSRIDRTVLATIRMMSVLMVLACLMRPTVVLSSAVNQRNVFAVLLDDSRSMRLRNVNGAARLAAMQRVFADSSQLMRRLSTRFALRVFRFAADAGPAFETAMACGAPR